MFEGFRRYAIIVVAALFAVFQTQGVPLVPADYEPVAKTLADAYLAILAVLSVFKPAPPAGQ
jgi:hypothetical protein